MEWKADDICSSTCSCRKCEAHARVGGLCRPGCILFRRKLLGAPVCCGAVQCGAVRCCAMLCDAVRWHVAARGRGGWLRNGPRWHLLIVTHRRKCCAPLFFVMARVVMSKGFIGTHEQNNRSRTVLVPKMKCFVTLRERVQLQSALLRRGDEGSLLARHIPTANLFNYYYASSRGRCAGFENRQQWR